MAERSNLRRCSERPVTYLLPDASEGQYVGFDERDREGGEEVTARPGSGHRSSMRRGRAAATNAIVLVTEGGPR
jgi:hypothetical protein